MKWYRFTENRYLVFASRLIIGGLLCTAGISKLLTANETIQFISTFQFIPDVLVRPLGVILPRAELVIGYFLVIGLAVKLSSALSVLLTPGFITVNIINLVHADTGCSCFGRLQLSSHISLGIDFLMLLIGIYIFFSKQDLFRLDNELKSVFAAFFTVKNQH